MADIQRHHTNQRMSQIVVHGDTIYLAGQVGTEGASVTQQTQDCLDQIDALLGEVGSDKTRILQAIIWLDDMKDFAEMNAVWDGWAAQSHTPARACGEAKLAAPGFTVEIIITAAKA